MIVVSAAEDREIEQFIQAHEDISSIGGMICVLVSALIFLFSSHDEIDTPFVWRMVSIAGFFTSLLLCVKE